MKKRYIKLTELEESALKTSKKTSGSERERDRSHALLLSNKGYTIDQLSAIFEVRRATVSEWFNRWDELGMAGLSDAEKSGRPTKFTETEQKK
ncbi:helix-turn-helix domain-containing protein [Aureispira sp. CCB-QB1]|uniref:helix-turn-helix domain-containing protein n=1 Tax=Aureispira sp. CCB-QB1 TaxID=1313421 RepID=UPI00069768DE|nr:helix-turn-helix domain-containing protein [Aureispira sp. CCB-QB1]